MIKKKILTVLLAFLGLSLVFFAILAWMGLFRQKAAGILIDTEPKSIVYIDNQEVGVTPYEANLPSGEILVRVVPEMLADQPLDDYETKVFLVPGVKTIIKRSFNLDETQTSGAVVSFEKIGGEGSYVTVVSVPDNLQIFIDGRAYGFTPLRVEIPAGDHDLLISGQGFLDKSLPIRTYKGYKLTSVVKLARNIIPEPTSEPVLSETSQNLGKIEINETDVGFLRVRSKSNTTSEVLGQVNPGDTFDVLEISEDNLWYKIEFENIIYGENGGIPTKLQGWVSGEFAKVIER